MRSFIFLALALFSFPAFAGTVTCKTTHGDFQTTVFPAGEVVTMEDAWSQPGEFSLAVVTKLKFDLFGEQNFVVKGLHFSKDTQIDFDHEKNDSVRALLLFRGTPGQAHLARYFTGTLIVTGMNVKATGAMNFQWRYLVMNLSCQY